MSASTLTASSKSGHPLLRWLRSTLGRKTVAAVTGIMLVLFLVVHLAGNLTIFLGPDAINEYARQLHELGVLLWVARIGLLVMLVLHVWATVTLIVENRAAKKTNYSYGNKVESTLFARTMRYTGFIVLAFIIFHLAHFALGLIQPEAYQLRDAQGRHDVYAMIILGFRNVPISVFYLVALFLLTFHLSHGLGSLFQTLGLSNQRLRLLWERSGIALAWLLFLGYASIPAAILVFNFGSEVAP